MMRLFCASAPAGARAKKSSPTMHVTVPSQSFRRPACQKHRGSIAVPSYAALTEGVWYTSDGDEIGPVI